MFLKIGNSPHLVEEVLNHHKLRRVRDILSDESGDDVSIHRRIAAS